MRPTRDTDRCAIHRAQHIKGETTDGSSGTAQRSALSPLLFILFINALLRLLDQSELHHGVMSAPQFSHLAFADDLSLYLNSEANANRLLEKVHLFEKCSGLRIALSKSFVTAVMHGKGAELIASEAARGFRGRTVPTSRMHRAIS